MNKQEIQKDIFILENKLSALNNAQQAMKILLN